MICKTSYKIVTSNQSNTAQWSRLQPILTASQLEKAEEKMKGSKEKKHKQNKKRFKDMFQWHLSWT